LWITCLTGSRPAPARNPCRSGSPCDPARRSHERAAFEPAGEGGRALEQRDHRGGCCRVRAWCGAPAGARRTARSGRAGRCRACCCFRTAPATPGSKGQPALDLIVTLDDATSEIYSAFLVEEEGTRSSFRGLAAPTPGPILPSSSRRFWSENHIPSTAYAPVLASCVCSKPSGEERLEAAFTRALEIGAPSYTPVASNLQEQHRSRWRAYQPRGSTDAPAIDRADIRGRRRDTVCRAGIRSLGPQGKASGRQVDDELEHFHQRVTCVDQLLGSYGLIPAS
jgi:hypothetical protein